MHNYRQSRIRHQLIIRARIIQAIRQFFIKEAFLEVETPNRIPANAPESHIDALPSGPWHLHTSPELCMKRMLAAGYNKIFQICKCYRQNERGTRHLPELTMLEWYEAQTDYQAMMTRCEALISFVARELELGETPTYQGRPMDLTPPWDRISVTEAFETYAGTTPETALSENRFDEIMGLEIEPHLGRRKPVFLYDYPSDCAALARRKPGNPTLAERFELYIHGIELCNAFSELVDPKEQQERFEAEIKKRRQWGKPEACLPEKFIQALSHMPAAAGNALGVDRLVMLFTDSQSIDDVVAFVPEDL